MSSSNGRVGEAGSTWLHDRRLVVSGLGSDGRTTIESDSYAPSRTTSAGTHITTLWQSNALPADATAVPSATWPDSMIPPASGVKVVVVTVPPDGERVGFGMHRTDSLDVFTVVSGEVVVVMEDDEVVLNPGDTLVQRAHRHEISNRADYPAVVLITLLGVDSAA
jgi:mannose-6-phosphate isomerase-like protein (cupin superfamily)